MALWLKVYALCLTLGTSEFRPVSFTIPYSKLYIWTERKANDVKNYISDRQKIDLSIYI